MANLFNNLSQLDRDYDALISKIKDIIPNLTDDWNDFSDSDASMFLVKLFAAIKDMQAYHFDKQVLERYLPTVQERKNLISILDLVSYTLTSYKASKVVCTISTDSTVTINRGQVFQLDMGTEVLYFTYLGPSASFADNSTITLYQGELKMWPSSLYSSDTVFSSYIDTNGNSVSALSSETTELVSIAISGINEKVAIDETSYLSIEGPQGEDIPEYLARWKEVTSFVEGIGSYSSSDYALYDNDTPSGNPAIYRLYVDRDNKTYIQFYNIETLLNVSGLKIRYLVTEGTSGRVAVGTELNGAVVSGNNTLSVTATVTAVTGGADPETVDQARSIVPSYTKSMNRAVTISDYTQLIRSFLYGNSDSEFTYYAKQAVSVVDNYKNNNVPSVHQISNYPALPYIVEAYAYVENGIPLGDIIDTYQDTGGGSKYPVYRSHAYEVDSIDQGSSPNTQYYLYNYLLDKRMVGISCYVNDYYYEGTTKTERTSTTADQVHSTINRFYIRVAYSKRTDHVIDFNAIMSAIDEQYPNDDSAFARSVYISDIIYSILKIDPLINIAPATGVSLYVAPDSTGDHGFVNSIHSSDFDVDDKHATLNEMLSFGGIIFIEV